LLAQRGKVQLVGGKKEGKKEIQLRKRRNRSKKGPVREERKGGARKPFRS